MVHGHEEGRLVDAVVEGDVDEVLVCETGQVLEGGRVALAAVVVDNVAGGRAAAGTAAI